MAQVNFSKGQLHSKRQSYDADYSARGPERLIITHPGDITRSKPLNQNEKLQRKLERNGKVFKFVSFDVKLVRHVLE